MDTITTEKKERVVIKFAGDSGDGMQMTGYQFTLNSAFAGNEAVNFPDFPSEIRAPRGTTSGVSGFQLHFGSSEVYTPGDKYDVLVALNAAAFKTNLPQLRQGGIIIINEDGFDKRNLQLAGYESNPLESDINESYIIYKIPITTLTREVLKESSLKLPDRDRCKNLFILGFLYWLYNRDPQNTIDFLNGKFKSKPAILNANLDVLNAGYNYGDITDTFTERYEVGSSNMEPGLYRGIMGNHAIALGLITAAEKSGLSLFYGSYPITPASDILHSLSGFINCGAITYQAEDEIAAICSAIGAAFGGQLAVTGTSGPGMSLKTEAIGLATMLELPLVIINVQRAGPSTGLPTKTEQADLLQAFYGRHGEGPLPVLAVRSPSDGFECAIEACRIAIQHMTPVILLSDGYIANGAEAWRIPDVETIPEIEAEFAQASNEGSKFQPYKRDKNLVRPWGIPGTKGLEHRVGGLEKENITGNVSYLPEVHEEMVKLREEKVNLVAGNIPKQELDSGPDNGSLLVIGWGSTYGSVKAAVNELRVEGVDVAHVHLRYLNPFPENLGEIIFNYDKVLVPEINNGQLVKIIKEKYVIPAIPYNKIKGTPITKGELKKEILGILNN